MCVKLGLPDKQKGDGEEAIISKENAEIVDGFKAKIDGIREVLDRDHMKVVFFGR